MRIMTADQRLATMLSLALNTDWNRVDGDLVQARIISSSSAPEAGREHTEFLINGARTQVVVPERQVIDCRRASRPADWTEEKGWKIEWHRNMGHQVFTPESFRTHLVDEQRDRRAIRGDKLRKILESEPVLTDNWLDFLLANPEFIPESWKGKMVFFWGTGYRDPDGNVHVRYLIWNGETWRWDYYWLGYGFHSSDPSAVLAS